MSDTVTFILDGQKVEAQKTLSIWEVANQKGFVIPHLCHKPAKGYRPDGNCRACMVEVEGERNLVASCIRQPTDGMIVKTNSSRAQTARKMVLEMLLADQPERAYSHDKSSHLWDMVELNELKDKIICFVVWLTVMLFLFVFYPLLRCFLMGQGMICFSKLIGKKDEIKVPEN